MRSGLRRTIRCVLLAAVSVVCLAAPAWAAIMCNVVGSADGWIRRVR